MPNPAVPRLHDFGQYVLCSIGVNEIMCRICRIITRYVVAVLD